MAFDCFLKIEAIPGESTDDKYADWIEIISYNHEVAHPTGGDVSGTGGALTGRCDHGPFTIVKKLDISSPMIHVYCSMGESVGEVNLTLNRASGDKLPYMEYKMEEAYISRVSPSGASKGEDLTPLEEVEFVYGKITWTYTKQKRADGSGGGKQSGGWDLDKNVKI
jgi:type VI secretion system secreted protein Hcp